MVVAGCKSKVVALVDALFKDGGTAVFMTGKTDPVEEATGNESSLVGKRDDDDDRDGVTVGFNNEACSKAAVAAAASGLTLALAERFRSRAATSSCCSCGGAAGGSPSNPGRADDSTEEVVPDGMLRSEERPAVSRGGLFDGKRGAPPSGLLLGIRGAPRLLGIKGAPTTPLPNDIGKTGRGGRTMGAALKPGPRPPKLG